MQQAHKINTRRKAQIAVTDFFIALFIFVILLSFIMLTWNRYNLRLNERLEYEDMLTQALQVSNGLVKTSGYPVNWNSSNVKVIGLASTDRVLSSDKLARFNNMSDADLIDTFKIAPYYFMFQLKNINGSAILAKGYAFSGDRSANIKRIVLYNGKEAIVEFSLWE